MQAIRELDRDTLIKRLQASYDAHDQVRLLRDHDTCLISSKSRDGLWHRCTAESCDCEWATYRKQPCRHMVRCSRELARRAHRQQAHAHAV